MSVLNVLISIIVAFLCGTVSFVTLQKKLCDRIPFLLPMKESDCEDDNDNDNAGLSDGVENKNSIELKKYIIWIITIITGVCVGVVSYRLFDSDSPFVWVNYCKYLIAMICVTGAGFVDLREKRIPNFFSAIIALDGIVCLVVQCMMYKEGSMNFIIQVVAGTLLTAIMLIVAMFLSKNGIGLGDVKIICAIALLGNVYLLWTMLFWGLVACIIISVILMITKKKTMKDSIPFGPFILIGYIIGILSFVF